MGSRSDKLFQKRKLKNQKHYIRQKPSVPERKRVLIVCEGEKTEPLYLRALVSHLGLTTAEVEKAVKRSLPCIYSTAPLAKEVQWNLTVFSPFHFVE